LRQRRSGDFPRCRRIDLVRHEELRQPVAPNSSRFVNYHPEVHEAATQRSSEIQSVWSDNQGYLWIGTASGLQMLDRKTGRSVMYQHDAKNAYSISKAPVFTFAESGSGKVWIGTYGGGLDLFDRSIGRFFRTGTTRRILPA